MFVLRPALISEAQLQLLMPHMELLTHLSAAHISAKPGAGLGACEVAVLLCH